MFTNCVCRFPFPVSSPHAICFWNPFSPVPVPLTSACANIVHPEILVSWDSPQCGPCPELIRKAELYEPNSQGTGWSIRTPVCPFAMRNPISSHSVRSSLVVRTEIALRNKITWMDRGFMGNANGLLPLGASGICNLFLTSPGGCSQLSYLMGLQVGRGMKAGK